MSSLPDARMVLDDGYYSLPDKRGFIRRWRKKAWYLSTIGLSIVVITLVIDRVLQSRTNGAMSSVRSKGLKYTRLRKAAVDKHTRYVEQLLKQDQDLARRCAQFTAINQQEPMLGQHSNVEFQKILEDTVVIKQPLLATVILIDRIKSQLNKDLPTLKKAVELQKRGMPLQTVQSQIELYKKQKEEGAASLATRTKVDDLVKRAIESCGILDSVQKWYTLSKEPHSIKEGADRIEKVCKEIDSHEKISSDIYHGWKPELLTKFLERDKIARLLEILESFKSKGGLDKALVDFRGTFENRATRITDNAVTKMSEFVCGRLDEACEHLGKQKKAAATGKIYQVGLLTCPSMHLADNPPKQQKSYISAALTTEEVPYTLKAAEFRYGAGANDHFHRIPQQ